MPPTVDLFKSQTSNGSNEQEVVCPEQFGFRKAVAKQILTPLDMNMPRLYATRWILCFPLPSSADKIKLYKELKTGLAYTISEIPWLGGDVEPEAETEPRSGKIQVSNGLSGVIFKYNDLTEGSASFPTYSQLKHSHFPLSELATQTLSPLGVMPQDRQPVMAAQANFIDGGLLLTLGAHHSVCDGTGLNAILNLWAQNTCAASLSASPVRVDPLITDRTPLMIGKPGAKLSEFPEYVLAPTPPAAINNLNSHQMAATPFHMPAMTARIFHFLPSSLVSLKSLARAHSTNDALQAFLWRHMTLARNPHEDSNSKPEGKGTTALLFAVNIRGRVSPPLPPNYLGNASMAGITKRLPIESMPMSSDSLVEAAACIRSSVKAFSAPDRVQQTIGLIASRPNPTDYKFAYNGFLGPDLSSTSWADFGIYDVEWGSLGKPEAFRIPGEGSDGTVIILPRLPGGGLEVVVGLEDGAMARLVEDKVFATFAELRA